MIADFFLRFYYSINIIVIIVIAADGNGMRLICWARFSSSFCLLISMHMHMHIH